MSSTLTIYLSSSASVYSSKDSPSVPHPGFSPDFPKLPPESAYGSVDHSPSSNIPKVEAGKLIVPAPRPRKTMYFAAGSGIPEIKTILSGTYILDARERSSLML